MKILHFTYNSFPILSGYTLRTHSIVTAQKKMGLLPSVAISTKSLIENFFRELKYASKTVYDDIYYYSAYNELISDYIFSLFSKFATKNNRFTNRIKRDYYSFRKKKILYKYYNFILSDFGSVDIIHSHSPSVTFNEAFIINKFYKKKLIYEVRGFWDLSMEDFNSDIMKAVSHDIRSCQKADKCVAIGKGIADVLIRGGIPKDQIEIVPNGVEPNKFKNNGKDINLLKSLKLDDKIIFGYITNVRWLEGIQTIIKSWSKILKIIPNAVFLLIGDGNYLETIKSMVGEYNIGDSFLTLGRIENDKIPSYYSLIDVFVVPRVNAPVSHIVTPLKPLEAMANSKPVVVSDVNALKEIVIDGETGLYFKADDHEHLADICVQLAKDSNLRHNLGTNAQNWVINNRTWDKIAAQYHEIYKELLK